MKGDCEDFVIACLERSRRIPLTVCLDLKRGDDRDHPDDICTPGDERSPGIQADEKNPCHFDATIDTLLSSGPVSRKMGWTGASRML